MKLRFFVSTLLPLFLSCVPMAARAVEPSEPNVSFEVRDNAFTLVLPVASTGEPRVLTTPGAVRMWIPTTHTDLRFSQDGDGVMVRRIEVRPGMSQTIVLVLELGDDRTLTPSAIRAQRTDHDTTLLIDRALLPQHSNKTTATSTPDTVALQAEEPARSEAVASSVVRARAPKRVGKADAPLSRPLKNGGNFGLMVVASLVLLGALLLLRYLQRHKKSQSDAPSIEIVASKRLSAKHQLVMVRVRGRDYLLSINGGSTQRIATFGATPSHLLPDEEDEADEQPSSTLSSTWFGRTSRTAPEQTPFGSELLKHALNSRQANSEPPSTRSESVSGLLRLRNLARR